MEQCLSVLDKIFGYKRFRHGQAKAIQAAMAGRDVLSILPTGGGKSLCYQVPAIAQFQKERGATIVISPLIALMDDQIRALKGRGVEAGAVHSHMDAATQRETMRAFAHGTMALLYVSPERATSPSFRQLVEQSRIALLAIDEAHCISQWGHDFRQEYSRLCELRHRCSAPMMALTATATPRVVDEIQRNLRLEDPEIVRGSFRRDNLHFRIHHVDSEAQRLKFVTNYLEKAGFRDKRSRGRALIYCATRKKVQSVAKALQAQGHAVGYYHAGRTELARKRAQRAFEAGRCRVFVATNAFGMGIDCPDVRLLLHYQCPGSVEAYYQEAGRAGRDGQQSLCVLLNGAADLVLQARLQAQGNAKRGQTALSQMRSYLQGETCRQAHFEAYFTGTNSRFCCGTCDVCKGDQNACPIDEDAPSGASSNAAQLPPAALQVILEAAQHMPHPVGKGTLAKALRGSRAAHIKRNGLTDIAEHAKLKAFSEADIVSAIEKFLQQGQLTRRGQKFPTVWPANRSLHHAETGSKIQRPELRDRLKQGNGYGPIFRDLENYRKRMARKLNWKPYMVMQKQAMSAVQRNQPKTLEALCRIPGLGPAKVDRFGEDILRIVAKHAH